MVKAAYSSGKPAYGVGAGNATMVIDETADVEQAARNTRISKTNDNGSGCSADGNLLVDASIYDALLAQLQAEGGYLVNTARSAPAAGSVLGRRRAPHARTRSRGRRRSWPRLAGFTIPAGQDVPDRRGTAHRQGASVLDREARHRPGGVQVPRLRRHALDHGAADLRDGRPAATRAASTRSTTTTSIGWRWWRRSAASWCGRCSRARTPARSPTACR